MSGAPLSARSLLVALMLALIVVAAGCAHQMALPEAAEQTAYQLTSGPADDLRRWAPVFLAYDTGHAYNRIGRPSAREGVGGHPSVYVDPAKPTVYTQQTAFDTHRGHYTNLIYRVHFPYIPFSAVPFHLTAGKNAGLMVVITLNDRSRPVLVTTVHTCGCYKAIVPTTELTPEQRPTGWTDQPLAVYGETLPAQVDFHHQPAPRLWVHLRPGVHRVMHLEVRDRASPAGGRAAVAGLAREPMDALQRLPYNGSVTSFFHDSGSMKGFVKGSVKPFEMLLLSLPSMDLLVGADKMYADSAVSGTRFYTSLKPWRRKASDMWDFAGFLRYWGWRL